LISRRIEEAAGFSSAVTLSQLLCFLVTDAGVPHSSRGVEICCLARTEHETLVLNRVYAVEHLFSSCCRANKAQATNMPLLLGSSCTTSGSLL
jgi:hypothetical protein